MGNLLSRFRHLLVLHFPGSLIFGSPVFQVPFFSRLSLLQVSLLCEFSFLQVSSSPGFYFSRFQLLRGSPLLQVNYSSFSLHQVLTSPGSLFARFSFLQVHTSPDFSSPGSLFSRFQLLQVTSSPGSHSSVGSLFSEGSIL